MHLTLEKREKERFGGVPTGTKKNTKGHDDNNTKIDCPFLNSLRFLRKKKRGLKNKHVVVLRATPTIVVVVQRPRREDLFFCLVIMLDFFFFFFVQRRKKSDFKVLREWGDFKTVGRPEAL